MLNNRRESKGSGRAGSDHDVGGGKLLVRVELFSQPASHMAQVWKFVWIAGSAGLSRMADVGLSGHA